MYAPLKTSLLMLVLLGFSYSADSAQPPGRSVEFNPREVPFSTSKSFLSVCKNRRSKNLALTDLRFALFGRQNEIFRFFYKADDEFLEPRALATPGLMTLSAGEQAFARACFESPALFRLQGETLPLVLVLDASLIEKNRLRVTKESPGVFHLESENRFGTARHILRGHDGTLRYDEKHTRFIVSPSADNTYALSLEESDQAWTTAGIERPFDACAATAREQYEEFLSTMPSVQEPYGASRALAAYVLWSCIVDRGGHFQRPAMLMSKNWMHYIWSWDHCFNAMACAYHAPGMAWNNYFTVFDAQEANGRLPDVLGYARLDRSVLKAPIHGWTLDRMQRTMTLNDAQLRDAYASLERWTRYWLDHRDSNHNGVPEYIQANDCWDNGSEFNINGDPNHIANRESATLSAYLITQMDQLHDLALKLGRQEEALAWKKESDRVLAHLCTTLWNGERFLTINLEDGSYNRDSRSLMRFVPVILGEKLPPEIVAAMKKDLTRGGYLTEWGLATESITSPLYLEDGYWLGPIWAPTTLIIADGFKRAGEEELAREIARKFCDLCVRSGFAENFNAKTGRPLRDPAYTWTASVFLILAHEYLD